MTGTTGVLVATGSFSPSDAVLLVVVVVLLAASAVLALAETSLVRMSRPKALALVEDGRRGAKQLVRLTENPQGFLNPVLLLVLICQLVVATLVGILAAHWFGAWGVVAATVFEIVVIFVLGEAVPKNWAVHHPERAALFSADPRPNFHRDNDRKSGGRIQGCEAVDFTPNTGTYSCHCGRFEV